MRELLLRDGADLLKRPQGRRRGEDELWVLRHWDELDAFLRQIRVAFREFESAKQPHAFDGSTFSGWVAVLAEDWIDVHSSEHFSLESTWFLVATFLDLRRDMVRRWGDLSRCDVEHLQFIFDLEAPRKDSSPVLPREEVALLLHARKGWSPAWYRPIPQV